MITNKFTNKHRRSNGDKIPVLLLVCTKLNDAVK